METKTELLKIKVNNFILKLKLKLTANTVFFVKGTQTLPPALKKSQEEEYIAKLAAGDNTVREKLIVHNLRLVVYIAKKFENSGVATDDLVSIGTIGLIKAVNTFTPEKNIKLATYASRCVENEILMYLRKISSRKSEISIDEPLNVDSDGNELLLGDVLANENDTVNGNIEYEDEKKLLLSVVDKLGDREKLIINMRFGMGGYKEYTQKEVADNLGISQSYISRLEKKIIDDIRKEMCKV